MREFTVMKKPLRICMGLLIVLGVAQWCVAADGPAKPGAAKTDKIPSGYVNSELPRWLKFGGQERVRMETQAGVGFASAKNTFLLQRVRLNLVATPLTWLSFTFQAQDSRVYFTNASPVPATQKAPIDLRLGYVQIGQGEEGP